MNVLDVALGLLLAASVITSFRKGLSREIVGLVSVLLALVLGIWFYGLVGAHVADYVSSRGAANLLGFLIVFAVFMIAGAVAGRVAASVFRWVGLSWLDRLMGAGFGLLRGAIITVALVTMILAFAPTPPPPSIAASRTLPYVIGTSSVLTAITPHEVKDAFQQTKEKLKKIWSDRLQRKPNDV